MINFKTRTAIKVSIAILITIGLALCYLKFRVLLPVAQLRYVDSIERNKQEEKNPLSEIMLNQGRVENKPVDQEKDSVFLYFLSENNYVQVMGEDDMPVFSFSLPEGEPLSDQTLTENDLVLNYSINGSETMVRQFKFTIVNGDCDFTADPLYKKWSTQTFNNIRFTKGAGRQADKGPFQSKLYSFIQAGHCFTFEALYLPDEVSPISTCNEAEEINFIEKVLESVKIY